MPQLHKHLNVVRHAMKNLSLFILLITLHVVASGQEKIWLIYNDSTIKRTIEFYSSNCASLNSSKEIRKEKIERDKSLIGLANNLYNNTSTIEDLKRVTKGFKKYVGSTKNTATTVTFRFISNGNLTLSFQAAEHNDSLIRKRISMGTNTKTGCKEKSECCLSYFDFIYIKNYFLKDINFPMEIEPYLSDLVIETGLW